MAPGEDKSCPLKTLRNQCRCRFWPLTNDLDWISLRIFYPSCAERWVDQKVVRFAEYAYAMAAKNGEGSIDIVRPDSYFASRFARIEVEMVHRPRGVNASQSDSEGSECHLNVNRRARLRCPESFDKAEVFLVERGNPLRIPDVVVNHRFPVCDH